MERSRGLVTWAAECSRCLQPPIDLTSGSNGQNVNDPFFSFYGVDDPPIAGPRGSPATCMPQQFAYAELKGFFASSRIRVRTRDSVVRSSRLRVFIASLERPTR